MIDAIILRILAYPISAIYLLFSTLNRVMYMWGFRKRVILPGVTISVGNLAVGGTGKSPITIELVRYLCASGCRPAIVTRGYGSGLKRGEFVEILNGSIVDGQTSGQSIHADEAVMQSVACPDVPIIVGINRKQAVSWYIGRSRPMPSHWILDDGFQHWPIERSIDIVLLDAESPLSNGWVLPAGRLRERPQQLRRADFVFLTRAQSERVDPQTESLVRRYYLGPMTTIKFVTGFPVSMPAGNALNLKDPQVKVAVVVGIAQPQLFIQDLKGMGIAIDHTYVVRDHKRFDLGHVATIAANVDAIVTTAKDYWREPQVFSQLPNPVFIAPLVVENIGQHLATVLPS